MSGGYDEMALFLEALELAGPAQAEFLAAIEDRECAARIGRLLDSHRELLAHGGRTRGYGPLQVRIAADPEQLVGMEFDGLTLRGVLGRGGMGVVFEAEQHEPRRRVAVKTLPPFLGGDEAGRARLRAEARALARLAHPGVAQIHGSGHTHALGGMPYVVMERVEGAPIDRWAVERELGVRGRVELVLQVCDAVAHAHGRGVIHRDLKPANVLVDRDGRAKVLDFGIARLVDGEAEDRGRTLSLQTHAGQIVGTLAYMSPEQLTGDPAAVDVRCDVYGLGVLTWQLLVGGLPIDLGGLSLASAVRRLEHHEVPRLGARVRALAGSDLELVVAKATERSSQQRYQSVAELAADLRRALAHQPVTARSPGFVYLLQKALRRHRLAAAAALAVVLAWTLGMVWALAERAEARAAEHRAVSAQAAAEDAARQDRQRARSMHRLYDLLANLVEAAAPMHHGGVSPTMDEVVAELAQAADDWAGADQHVRGVLHLFLSRAMSARDDHERAVLHARMAREALEQSPITGDLERSLLVLREAMLHQEVGEHDRAWQLLEPGWELAQSLGDQALTAVFARSMAAALVALRGDMAHAERLVDDALLAERAGDPTGIGQARLLMSRARIQQAGGRVDAALASYRDAADLLRGERPDSWLLADALAAEGHLLHVSGRFAEAAPLLEDAVARMRMVFAGRPSRHLARALDNLAASRRALGDPEAALALLDEAAADFRAVGAVARRDLAVCLEERGMTLLELGRSAEALESLRAALQMHREDGSSVGTVLASTLECLALAELRTGAAELAQMHGEEALEIRRQVHGVDHHLTARPLEVLGAVAHERGDLEAMERIGREALRVRRPHYGDDHWTTWADAWLIWIPLARRGELDEARELCRTARERFRDHLGPRSAKHLMALDHLAQLEELLGNSDAAALLREERQGLVGSGR